MLQQDLGAQDRENSWARLGPADSDRAAERSQLDARLPAPRELCDRPFEIGRLLARIGQPLRRTSNRADRYRALKNSAPFRRARTDRAVANSPDAAADAERLRRRRVPLLQAEHGRATFSSSISAYETKLMVVGQCHFRSIEQHLIAVAFVGIDKGQQNGHGSREILRRANGLTGTRHPGDRVYPILCEVIRHRNG